jgi:hypothetical protein
MIGTRKTGVIRDLDPVGHRLVVKNSKPPSTAGEPWPYTLADLALFPTWLTIAAAAASFLVAGIGGGPEAYSLAAGFAVGSAAIFYSVTFLVGGLGLVPAVLRRFRRRVARRRSRGLGPGKPLWDEWMDGP